ncbi:hypothetical protein Poli38472_009121 [Pythium oligandrum]|uniref:Carbohydrate-binding domain-containing protein n=1 Tax=Pythium oligandrum TaxID=41045 RepID=A0A8K1CKX5_PYTOL|nr:hypothetical protein Poli38472_009121 [Pythium oligandrum]|eukprot:TMW64954.1 hypothetical protein Poli38472_009121 [Pythium oligandrum]
MMGRSLAFAAWICASLPHTTAFRAPAPTPDVDCFYQERHPHSYRAYHLQNGWLTIDGVLNESAWEAVPFSSSFLDIQGRRHWSQPWFTTQVKMRYDDTMLYIGAYLEETAIWANETKRNSVVFHDNDFEVFVDPDGTTHNYKEIEVNALNTTWNLWLNKPYRNGGHENSTRVDPAHGFDMFGHGFESAVHVDGAVNDATQRLHYWTVEMALPLAQLALHTQQEKTMPPQPNTHWRINFSRVEWQVRVRDGHSYEKIPGIPESNWVWSPQYAIDMHMPENWGYVVFEGREQTPPSDNPEPYFDPEWSHRFVAFQVYYAQAAYYKLHGYYALSWSGEVQALVPEPSSIKCIHSVDIRASSKGQMYTAQVVRIHDTRVAIIRSDGFITVEMRKESDLVAIS